MVWLMPYAWGWRAEISTRKHLHHEDFHFLMWKMAYPKISGREECFSERSVKRKKQRIKIISTGFVGKQGCTSAIRFSNTTHSDDTGRKVLFYLKLNHTTLYGNNSLHRKLYFFYIAFLFYKCQLSVLRSPNKSKL